MRLIDIITRLLLKANANAPDLLEALKKAKQAAPDLAPLLDPLIATLESGADVAGVATVIVPELGAIAMFKFDGAEHPSDAF